MTRRRTKGEILDEVRRTGRSLTLEEFRKVAAPKPPSEHAEQCHLASWVRAHRDEYPALHNFTAMPLQGGKGQTHRLRAIMRKQEGVEAGYPDVLLDAARGGWFGLRVELKRSAYWSARLGGPLRAGEPEPAQVAWHERLTREGYLVWVCWGWEAARDVVRWYATLAPTAFVDYECAIVPIPAIPQARIHLLAGEGP